MLDALVRICHQHRGCALEIVGISEIIHKRAVNTAAKVLLRYLRGTM